MLYSSFHTGFVQSSYKHHMLSWTWILLCAIPIPTCIFGGLNTCIQSSYILIHTNACALAHLQACGWPSVTPDACWNIWKLVEVSPWHNNGHSESKLGPRNQPFHPKCVWWWSMGRETSVMSMQWITYALERWQIFNINKRTYLDIGIFIDSLVSSWKFKLAPSKQPLKYTNTHPDCSIGTRNFWKKWLTL